MGMIEILLGLLTLSCVILLYFKYAYTYWARRNVPFIKPKFPMGNNTVILPRGIAIGITSKMWYDKLKKDGHKFGGIYAVTQPILLVTDPDYVRDVLSLDFQSFTNRGVYQNEHNDPLSSNIFTQDGGDWRNLRVKFTPTFTSGKMKLMFDNVVKCSIYLMEALEKFADEKAVVDIHETAARFTTDVIGISAFGIDCKSFIEPNSEFRRMGKRTFDVDIWLAIKLFFIINMPNLSLKMGLTITNNAVGKFFQRITRESVSYREKHNIVRPDFLHLLIELKNKAEEGNKLSLDEIASQAFLFFLAGFETSSTTMTYSLYELSRNPEVQELLRKEVNDVIEKHNGKITYEGIMEMKYLGQIIDETLRLYPPVPTLNRVCVKDYKFKGTDAVVEKGTPILVSTLGLHRDPEYWPDPLKWDPDRFSDENKKNRHRYVHIPFGEGPRNCIGLRFGLMQTKIGLASIIKNFKVTLNSKTVTPMELNPNTFVLFPLNKVYLNFEKI